MKQESLFRKAALERLSSPEQLDLFMEVTDPRAWLALIAMGLLLAAAVAWSIFGVIPTKIAGKGILIRKGGVFDVVTLGSGRLTQVDVTPGDIVKKDQVIARIAQPDLLDQVNYAKEELNELRAQHQILTGFLNKDTDFQKQQQLSASELRISDQQRKVQLLESQLEHSSHVTSPYDGRILEVKVDVGNFVSVGTSIVSLELNEAKLQALLYLPAAEGKRVHAGMEAFISPTTVRREEYGMILAKVKSVSGFPATHQGMMRMLENESLVQSLAKSGPPLEVYADLTTEPATESGYHWSSRKGPPVQIYSGTLCDGMVTVQKQRPINLLIPYIRETLGI